MDRISKVVWTMLIIACFVAGWRIYDLEFSAEAKSRKAAHESIVLEGDMGGWSVKVVERVVTLAPEQVGKSLWVMRVKDPEDASAKETLAFVEKVPCERDNLLPYAGDVIKLDQRMFRADSKWNAPRGHDLEQPLYLTSSRCAE